MKLRLAPETKSNDFNVHFEWENYFIGHVVVIAHCALKIFSSEKKTTIFHSPCNCCTTIATYRVVHTIACGAHIDSHTKYAEWARESFVDETLPKPARFTRRQDFLSFSICTHVDCLSSFCYEGALFFFY